MVRVNEYGQPVGDAVDWVGARPVSRSVLSGTEVRLEPVEELHVGGIAELGRHPDLWTYQSEEPPRDSESAAAVVRAMRDSPDSLAFAIVASTTGEVLGRASYLRIQPGIGSIEVGAIIHGPRLRRTRAATEAQYLLLRHAFDELGYRRYEWKCDSLNAPSRRAALRLGFTEEGTWRQALVTKGRNRDTTWFSITDGEWPAVDAAIRTWLDPANHDETGRQVRSLADVRASL
jgi:RimJ/RimL family protein N-acetyltransferase